MRKKDEREEQEGKGRRIKRSGRRRRTDRVDVDGNGGLSPSEAGSETVCAGIYVRVYTDLSIRQTVFSTGLRSSSGYRLRGSGIVRSLLRGRHALHVA